MFAGAMIAGFMLLRPQPQQAILPTLYPTLEPTPACDSDTWHADFATRRDRFIVIASAASRTLPGDRLNERIAELQATRDNFTAPCDADYRADYDAHLQAFDELLSILTQWSNGDLDGTQFSMAFDSAWQAIR